MSDIDCLHVRDPAEAFDLGIDTVEVSGCSEHALPGIFFIACHVIVGMVARDDHQGTENDFLVTGVSNFSNHFFAGSIFGLAFNCADEDICVVQCFHLGLHLVIGHARDMGSTVAHEYECRAVGCCCVEIIVTGFCDCLSDDCFGNCFLVRVDHSCILADFAQKRLSDADSLKIVLDCLNCCYEIIILCAVHQVCGLYEQVLDAILLCACQSLVDIVDGFAVARLDMVDDDLGCERSAHGPVGISFLQGLLDTADISRAALVEGSAEADYEKLVLADLICVERVICGCIAGVAAEIIGIGLFAFDQGLLLVGQCIPCCLCSCDIIIRRLGALLHIDRIDQGCTLRCQLFIGLLCRCLGCCCGLCRCRLLG